MSFELNLGRLNLGDCYLQLNMVDLAVKYINECQLFFEEMGVSTALYYIDTQKIELALLQKDFQEARRLLSESVVPPGIDPDMVHIRNKIPSAVLRGNRQLQEGLSLSAEEQPA